MTFHPSLKPALEYLEELEKMNPNHAILNVSGFVMLFLSKFDGKEELKKEFCYNINKADFAKYNN